MKSLDDDWKTIKSKNESISA